MALYWIMLFTSQWWENRDAIFISMKTFNDEAIDKYPTFSLCFQGDKFHWFRDNNIFHSYGLNATQYELMLKGDMAMMDELNQTTSLYRKKAVVLKDGKDVTFDRFYLTITDFLHELHYFTEENDNDIHLTNDGRSDETFDDYIHLSYQTAEKICFTRKSVDYLKSIRLKDLITFNSSVVGHDVYKDTEIQVFIHLPGQLIRSFDTPSYKASLLYFTSTLNRNGNKEPSLLSFQVSQVKQIRKREKSNLPCNQKIDDYDRYFQEHISYELGCIPPYWKQSFSNKSQLEECTTPKQLQDIFKKTSYLTYVLGLKEVPCNEMKLLSISSINVDPDPKPKDISIEFMYTEKTYEEIQYSKMMGFDGWLSNVGGFIGIFLGYSLLQIPEILSGFVVFFHRRRYQEIKSNQSLFMKFLVLHLMK